MWPVEVVLLLVPTGMVSVWSGSIDDGYGGMLGWFWVACAVTTIGLVVVTRAALKERAYSAVMAATGLLYLAILTAFGTDLVARAVLSGVGGGTDGPRLRSVDRFASASALRDRARSKAFTAVRATTVHFNQLDKKTRVARIEHQQAVRRSRASEVRDPRRHRDGPTRSVRARYVTFDDRASSTTCGPSRPRPSRSSDFVALADIDPIYYERTYWLVGRRRRPQGLRSCCSRPWRTRQRWASPAS